MLVSLVLGLLVSITSSLPLNATSVQCVNDGPVQALFANVDSVESFCRDFAEYIKPTPAFLITESATTTSLTGAVTTNVVTTSTATITFTAQADYGVWNTTTVTRPTCTSTAAAAPPVPMRGGGAPAVGHGGKRDVQIPTYLATYQPSQISSACTCLGSTQAQATVTTTSTTTVTGSADTVTQTQTSLAFANTQILLGATRMMVQTACVTA